MAEVVSMVLLGDAIQSEGEISLGLRLDQVLVFSGLPADLEMAIYVEVRLDPETDGTGVNVAAAIEGEDFVLPLGSRTVPFAPRGSAWPFVPDVPLLFPVTVRVPDESAAFVTVRIDDEIRQVKWIRAVGFPLLGT